LTPLIGVNKKGWSCVGEGERGERMVQQPKVDATYLEKPYTVFLFKGIMDIYEAWDEGNVEFALRRALRLVVFLPSDIKKALWDDKKRIEKDLGQAYKTAGVDWYTRQQNRNRAARRVAGYYIEPFVDEMVQLLDEKGWLERGALRPRAKGHGKLSI